VFSNVHFVYPDIRSLILPNTDLEVGLHFRDRVGGPFNVHKESSLATLYIWQNLKTSVCTFCVPFDAIVAFKEGNQSPLRSLARTHAKQEIHMFHAQTGTLLVKPKCCKNLLMIGNVFVMLKACIGANITAGFLPGLVMQSDEKSGKLQ
jgi:hypothetical protein